MPYQLPQETAHLERTGCQAEIAVAKRRVRLLKPFAELQKLTLSSIPWLRRTGADFIVPLISAAENRRTIPAVEASVDIVRQE
jgi:hypothetical protein